MSRLDVPAVARVHCHAFPTSALSKLGGGTVRRYYDWQFIAPHQVIRLGAFLEGRLVGYCIAGTLRDATRGFVRRNLHWLVVAGVRHPSVVVAGLRQGQLQVLVRSLRSRRSRPHGLGVRRSYGVLAIAVEPGAQGLGLGRCLLKAAEDDALRRGFARMHLTVDPTNQNALGFYRRMGWRLAPLQGPWRGRLEKDLVD